jgi:prepilin-type N-terminal cleavage/methylation domain-containing protein/prepilin-type processing-associated H-X9-DG protein
METKSGKCQSEHPPAPRTHPLPAPAIINHQSSLINSKAFTLIELLVVISIVALLIALAMPALSRARKHAQAVACQANLHQWAMIFQEYTNDHEGRWFRTGVALKDGQLWRVLRMNIEDYERLTRCPAEGVVEGRRSKSPYTPNSWLDDYRPPSGQWGPPWEERFFWRNIYTVKNPATMPVFLDASATWTWGTPLPWDQPPPYNGAVVAYMGFFCVSRHGSFVNSLFLDWSVRRVGLKQLWTLKWHREFDTTGPWTKAGGVQPSDWPEWMRKFKDY